jgi:hypothetical protein
VGTVTAVPVTSVTVRVAAPVEVSDGSSLPPQAATEPMSAAVRTAVSSFMNTPLLGLP